MDVKRFRLVRGISVKEVVAVLRPDFPKYSKAVQSMVENPGSYGVRLLPEAEQILIERLGQQEGRTGDRHKRQHRLSCRVTESRYNAVKRFVEQEGRFPTVQAWLDWWIYVWLQRQEKAAPGGSNTRDGNTENNSMNNLPQEGGDVNERDPVSGG